MKCLSFRCPRSRFRTRVILFLGSSFSRVPRSFRTAACRIAGTDIVFCAVGDEGHKFRYRGSKWFWVRAIVAGFPICEIAREIVRLWAEINDRPSIWYVATEPRPLRLTPSDRIATFSLVPLSINRLPFLKRLPVVSQERRPIRHPPNDPHKRVTSNANGFALSIYSQTRGKQGPLVMSRPCCSAANSTFPTKSVRHNLLSTSRCATCWKTLDKLRAWARERERVATWDKSGSLKHVNALGDYGEWRVASP